jgi:ABC-type glycerol-3-phosphate transport system substrate-binding protein
MFNTWRRGAALLALSACGGPAAPAPTAQPGGATDATAIGTAPPNQPDTGATVAPGAEGVVTIGFAAPEFERQAYEPLITAFNSQNSDVRVEFVPLAMQSAQSPDQLMRQLVSSADTAATFFLRPEDIKNGLVRDLAPLIDADPSFDRDDYYPGALTSGSDSSVYMLPRTLHLALLSYNKDLWARRGLPAPKPGWTWSDLLATAEQLAQKRGDTVDVYGLADGRGGLAALGGLLTEAGVDRSTAAEQLHLDQPTIAQALERLAGLAKSGAIYTDTDVGDRQSPDQFLKLIADQRVAMWFGAPVMIGPDVPKPAFAVGTAALPPIGGPLEDGAEGYVMRACTAHPEAAWRWLSFLSRQEVRQPFMEANSVNSVPARKSLAERSGFWKQLDPDTAAAAQAVRFYLDLLRNYSPHERIQGYTRDMALGGDTFQLIDEGRVGMWLDLPGGVQIMIVGPGAGGRQSYTRALAPLPGAGKITPERFESSGLYISAQAQHTDVCWQWLKFLSSDVSALGDGDFPARRSVAESDAFLKRAPAGAAEVYAAYRPALDRAPAAGGQSSEPDRPRVDLFWFFRAVDRALQGKDLERELADAQAKTEQFMTCVQGGEAALACAKQVDPTYAGLAGNEGSR